MNNKGFAISSILYTILIIFLVYLMITLYSLQNKKTILDNLKADTIEAVENENNYEYLLNEINQLKQTINIPNHEIVLQLRNQSFNLVSGWQTLYSYTVQDDGLYLGTMCAVGYAGGTATRIITGFQSELNTNNTGFNSRQETYTSSGYFSGCAIDINELSAGDVVTVGVYSGVAYTASTRTYDLIIMKLN